MMLSLLAGTVLDLIKYDQFGTTWKDYEEGVSRGLYARQGSKHGQWAPALLTSLPHEGEEPDLSASLGHQMQIGVWASHRSWELGKKGDPGLNANTEGEHGSWRRMEPAIWKPPPQ